MRGEKAWKAKDDKQLAKDGTGKGEDNILVLHEKMRKKSSHMGKGRWGDAWHFSSELASFSGFSSFQIVAGPWCNYKTLLVCWFRIQLRFMSMKHETATMKSPGMFVARKKGSKNSSDKIQPIIRQVETGGNMRHFALFPPSSRHF